MRIHELARELGVSSKELMAHLRKLGVEAKSHMAAVDDTAVALMREECGAKRAPPAPPEPTAPVVPAAPAPELRPEEQALPPLSVEGRTIRVSGPVVVRDLAHALGVKPNQLIARLMEMNVLAAISQRIDVAVAKKAAEKFGFVVEHEKRAPEHKPPPSRRKPEPVADRPEDLSPRPPTVTFMGHVDHGKTTLLDRIRNSSVAKSEHGGITQHIGAYTVDVGGRSITFLDTPGHAAFTAMRARGANLTDIVVLVVAADDGVMPQTKEAILHARAANVPIIVAINKIDLPAANVDKVKRGLQAEGLTPEGWGGDVICVEVSGATGAGIDHLLEMILLQADLLELKANPYKLASGYVIEARLEAGMGPIANVLVSDGTLNVGDAVVCGPHWGRVRALINDRGVKIRSARPSTPVKCLGMSGVPTPGAAFKACRTDREAREAAEQAAEQARAARPAEVRKVSLEALAEQIRHQETIALNAIVKADVQGSVEAIVHALGEIKSSKVALNILLSAPGNVTVNDVMLASASRAVIFAFHVGCEADVPATLKREGGEIRYHKVIYELVDEVKNAMAGLLRPVVREVILGRAKVLKVFDVGKDGKAAGCLITEGLVRMGVSARVKRGDSVVYQGTVVSLKRFKDQATEVRESQECGLRVDKFKDYAEGDIVEFYRTEYEAQSL